MSTKQLSNIVASTMPEYLRDLADNWFRGHPFLDALMGSGIQRGHSGGQFIQTPLIVDGNDNIRSYHGYDPLPTNPTKEFGYATSPWRQWAAGLSTCGYEVCVNQGPQAVFNLVQQKQRVLDMSIQNYMSDKFLTSSGRGNNNKDFYGLPRILGGVTIPQPHLDLPGAPIYPELGGLDATDPACAFWSAYIDDGGAAAAIAAGQTPPAPRPLTTKLLYQTMLCIGRNGMANKPNLIATSKELWMDLAIQLQPQMMQGNSSAVSMGIESISWMGVTIVWDEDIPADTVLFINTNFLHWEVNTNCYMQMRPWITPVNQDAQYTQILSMANLSTDTRDMHGMLCNVRPLCS